MNKFLTTQEAAAVVGVSRQRFYIIATRYGVSSAGVVKEKGKQGRSVIWRSEDIERMAANHRQRLEALAELQKTMGAL